MSRRNYKKIEQQPLPPFAENLVFWAPLTEGDLTDHISGNTIKATGYGSLVWDSAEKSYSTTLPSELRQVAAYVDNLNLDIVDDITTVFNYKELSQNDNFRVGYFTKNPPNDAYPYALPFVFGGPRGLIGEWKNFVCVWKKSNGGFVAYRNKEVYNTQTIVTEITQECLKALSFGAKMGSAQKGGYFFKDLRIYNRALTAQEVAQL